VRSCSPRARSGGPAIIQQAAERTGGTLREQSFLFRGTSIARAFRAILDDFRQSYVLRYTATGVDGPGWHAIAVTVPGVRGATVRARQGYYGK
jgi:hypothetical protein